MWPALLVVSTVASVVAGWRVALRVTEVLLGHQGADGGYFGAYRGAAIAGFAASSALAAVVYRSSRDPRPLYVAIAAAILAAGYLAFGVAWPNIRSATYAPDGSPQFSRIPIDGLFVCWAAAAACFRLTVPWWDRRGRRPISPIKASLWVIAPLAASIGALVVWNPLGSVPVSSPFLSTSVTPPPLVGIDVAIGTVAATLLALEAWRSWSASTTDPSQGLVALACAAGALAVVGTILLDEAGADFPRAAGLSFLLPGVSAAALFFSVLSTQRTEASQARRATDRAQEVMGGRAEIASMIAHELRGPVTTVRGLASTASTHYDSLSDAERLEFFQLIDQEALRLLHIVDETSMSMKVDAGTLSYDIRDEDLGRVVTDAVEKAKTGDHPVTVDVPEGLRLPLDRLRMQETLVQLLDNAARFSPPDGPIDLRVTADDREITIDVSDRGPGFAPHLREKAFERFAKFRPRGYEEVPGPGLGLSIAQAHIKALGGRIVIDDGPGGGTIQRILLPNAHGGPVGGG
jgi:signal transduction histidine kinase